jgi:hypothetical protein
MTGRFSGVRFAVDEIGRLTPTPTPQGGEYGKIN